MPRAGRLQAIAVQSSCNTYNLRPPKSGVHYIINRHNSLGTIKECDRRYESVKRGCFGFIKWAVA